MTSETFAPVFQVSEFNEAINNHLSLLGEVTVEGELTRLDLKNGRLLFASIKDTVSSLDIFSMTHLIKNFRQLEPGMLVRVAGTAGVYRGTTKFRLMASAIEPQGEGALQLAFEKLKRQLEVEGLFDPQRKRPLPLWPQRIGLLTAKNSSAYYDLVKILSARMSGLRLRLLPVNVQGRAAIPTILNALNYINHHPKDFDVVIMARGGGSLEDLQAFNSEEIARAVFSTQVPIVSAIGHEDNWSLCDYVADLRASTPSNAAELIVRDRQEVIRDITGSLQLIQELLAHRFSQIKTSITETHLVMHRYSAKINQQIAAMLTLINQRTFLSLTLMRQELEHISRLLVSLDYRQVLARGFSITKNQLGHIIRSNSQVSANDVIITQLAKGEIQSYVK